MKLFIRVKRSSPARLGECLRPVANDRDDVLWSMPLSCGEWSDDSNQLYVQIDDTTTFVLFTEKYTDGEGPEFGALQLSATVDSPSATNVSERHFCQMHPLVYGTLFSR